MTKISPTGTYQSPPLIAEPTQKEKTRKRGKKMEANGAWSTGFNVLNNLAQGGAFGSTVSKYAEVINPRNPISTPQQAPPPPPKPGQQGVNTSVPAPGGFGEHLKKNWGKYALGLGVVVVLFVGIKYARR